MQPRGLVPIAIPILLGCTLLGGCKDGSTALVVTSPTPTTAALGEGGGAVTTPFPPFIATSALPRPEPAPATPAPSGSPPAPTGPAHPTNSASPDGLRILANIRQLSEAIGPRVSGSSAEQAAVAFIRSQLESDGYVVILFGFDYVGDRFQPAKVINGSTEIAAFSLAGSAGGRVSGRADYVGLADAEGIGGRSLAGAIAIADRGTLRFAEKYDNVRAAGAVGLAIANNDAGTFSGNLQKPAAFPVVSVSQVDGAALRMAASVGASITIDSPPAANTHSVDIIARPRPDSRCKVLVGGHHDTVASAPGANDNGSGAATVLELARAFAADGLDEGLCFATFGGEESGLYGSHALAEALKDEGSLPEVMVNLDVTGIGLGVVVIGSPDPVQRAIRLAGQLGIPALAAELPPNTGSDHQSFLDAGVPVVFFTSGEFANIHSPRDVVSEIDTAELDRVGRLAHATIRDLLGPVAQP